jgi:glycosyltransferase involved in cell wall biosynthesis
MPELSVCLITRDEEKNIFRCLKSIRNIADEIILVDTGSKDNTLNIAKEFKCRIFQIQWQDDFSAARNFALDKAVGEWILIIDADEEFRKEDEKALKDLLENPVAEGYFVQILNSLEHNQVLKHRAVRLFRNRPEYRYTGRIHEQIAPAILKKNPQSLYSSPIRFIHFGYNQDAVINKQERNIKILIRELEEMPEEPFTLFNLATEYFIMADYAKAAENYEKAKQFSFQEQPYHATISRNLAITYLKLKEYKKCKELIAQGIEWYPDYTDMYYLLGSLKADQGFLDEASEIFKKCLELGEVEHYTSTDGVGSFLALQELAKVLEKKGNYQEALAAYIQAIAYEQVKERAIEKIPPLVIHTRKKDILKEIEDLGLNAQEYLFLADNFAYWENYSISLEILNYFTQNDFIKFFRVHCLLHQQKFNDALIELKQITTPPDPVAFWSNVFLCACGLKDEELFTKSINHLEKIISSEQIQVFKDLVAAEEKERFFNSPAYLTECWKILKEFINLNLDEWFNKAVNLARPIKEFETLFLVVNILWNQASPLTEEYLKKINQEDKVSLLTIIEADLKLEQGNFERAWELFNFVANLLPDDDFIKTGISLSALKQAEKLGKEALKRFKDSELIDERVKIIEEEMPLLEDKYKFLRLKRRKENDVLQTLLNSLYDNQK